MPIKLTIKIGDIDISYEGEAAFVSKELPSLVEGIRPHAREAPRSNPSGYGGGGAGPDQGDEDVGTLATYLQTKNAAKNQRRRFLATAHWLQAKGNKNPTTADVSRALVEHQQSRLSNPSQCLNENVKSGFCVKQDKGFYVTPEGVKELT